METVEQLPSNKKFGYFFGVVFAFASSYFYWSESVSLSAVFAVLAAVTFILALLASHVLEPFNKLWMKLGLLLGKIVSPIVMGIIYALIFIPVGLFMRAIGRDELRIKRRDSFSHWKQRDPVGSDTESFKNQF